MPLLVNLRHLEDDSVRFKGELPVEELDLDVRDEMIRADRPLEHDFEVQLVDRSLLLQGTLRLLLNCDCVRCLKSFTHEVRLENWTRYLPLDGEEKLPVVNDVADLTPYVREDILLGFPQHPLCEADCSGLPQIDTGRATKASDPGQTVEESSA